jgi:putative copper export protein
MGGNPRSDGGTVLRSGRRFRPRHRFQRDLLGLGEIRGLREVTASTYGLVFLAKLGAFMPVLALGGVNNRWTKPRLLKAVRQETPARSSLALLRRLVALEIGLIAVVLALTVFLLQLSPPAPG